MAICQWERMVNNWGGKKGDRFLCKKYIQKIQKIYPSNTSPDIPPLNFLISFSTQKYFSTLLLPIFFNQWKEFYLTTVSDLQLHSTISCTISTCGLVFYPEDGGSRFLYVGALKSSQPRPQMATLSVRFFFPLSWYISHRHPCEIASHTIKQFVLYSCLKQECCLYPLKWIKLSIVRL